MVKIKWYSKLPNRTRNDQKVKFAFFNSPEYKMQEIKRFFGKYQACGNISADTLVYALMIILIFHRI